MTRTVDPDEIERFSAIAAEWWDPAGKFAPLHKLNPVRLTYIRDALTHHFARDAKAPRPLEGLNLLDIGCGGGLLCEPMHRLGAAVTGLDAGEANIKTAQAHAGALGLAIDYQATTVEALAGEGKQFDAILNMEVIEHVADRALFLQATATLLKPGGILVASTMNRTLRALGLAVIGAEYILGWLPRGTHNWNKFITPAELEADLKRAGLTVTGKIGMVYNPLFDRWSLADDLAVNYMVTALKNPLD